MKKRTLELWKVNTMLIALSVFLMCLSSVNQTMAQESGENYTIDLLGKVKLEMVWIEPGIFKMGSPKNEKGRNENELQHTVTISREFWMGKYEVTQRQWNVIMGSSRTQHATGENLPVSSVTWDEAMEFCEELTRMEKKAGNLPKGYKYSLPTEAQWEYACRAGTRTSLNNGENITAGEKCPYLDKVGWYNANSHLNFNNVKNGVYIDDAKNYGTPHPVGKKLPNDWGLYDMHGNVREWCLDCGDPEIKNHPDGSTSYSTVVLQTSIYKDGIKDPLSTKGLYRICRGGDWWSSPVGCRSACRSIYEPDHSFMLIGFRVALVFDSNITVPLGENVDLDMIWINPGKFRMGSPKNEKGRSENELQHEVTLTQGYWMGKYEVTQAQYEAVTGKNPSLSKGADLPVQRVDWYDAKAFCEKLTEIEKAPCLLPEGYQYTLPTEAQWEYACRAGTTTALNSGKNLSDKYQCPEMDEVGWYKYNSDDKTHPVGQKLPNDWGLYDMHGNVSEWCLDWWNRYEYDSSSAVMDPKGPSEGSYRVIRGGDRCGDRAYECRSAYRDYGYPSSYIFSRGFRVALSLVQ